MEEQQPGELPHDVYGLGKLAGGMAVAQFMAGWIEGRLERGPIGCEVEVMARNIADIAVRILKERGVDFSNRREH